ncbi:MAG TPA: helix-turn-helix transcriptional regulator [Caulobacteraceae bacterium]|jgi:transcriptional regulator with XRE-family HTH domain|nr:helix-turn-helix transcriptional regulator [Caulobacteraceae bacterium]
MTRDELLQGLAQALRQRRLAQGWSQLEAAERSGVPHRTWRRLEAAGEGSIKHLVQAAIALRCEANLALLFPAPAATSMDALLAQQAAEAPARPRARVSRRRAP